MKDDECLRNRDSRESRGREATPIAIVAGILLLALAVRLIYAYGLPLNVDERVHLQIAEEISLLPGSFNLPLDTPATNHPLGTVYLTALANWVGAGNVFVIRLVFIALSLVGLVGLYILGTTMFGSRLSLLVLSLAALDRHLVALAPVFLESQSMVSLIPWAMLAMRRCLHRGSARDWLATGVLFGVGYWLCTLFVVMLLPFGLYILLTGKLGQVLKSRWMYAGLAVMLAIILPNLMPDLINGSSNYERNVRKVRSVGLSPRMALVYIGDLLICSRGTTWIVQNAGGKMYLPFNVTCHWVTGLLYIAAGAMSLRFWRDERIVLLLTLIVGFLIPVTLVDAREPWNDFTWASSTVFAAILLTAFVIGRMFVGKPGRVIGSVVLTYCLLAISCFLAGPKWGYFCPEWERFYLGQVLATQRRADWDPSRFPMDEALREIRQLTDRAIDQHPDSAMAWYFRGFYADDIRERSLAFEQALGLDPDNPLVMTEQAGDLIEAGDWVTAKELLESLVARGVRSIKVMVMLTDTEFYSGNYASSAKYARELAESRPNDHQPYRLLFRSYDAMGREAEAESALEVYATRHPASRAAAYLDLARYFWDFDQSEKGRVFLERAIKADPRGAECHTAIGFLLLGKLNDVDRAIEHLQAAARAGSTDPRVFYNLAAAWEKKSDFPNAIDYYRRAIRLDPTIGLAHLRLGNLLAQLNRNTEAKYHLEMAQRLGAAPPKSSSVKPEAE